MLTTNRIHENLTEAIIRCGIIAHAELGAGLLESIYTPCLTMELEAAGFDVERGRHVPIIYKGRPLLQPDLQVDLIVEGTVLVEVKAVEAVARVHKAQVITYLKLTGLPVGLLMNFNVPVLHEGVHRLVHPKLYERPARPNLDPNQKLDPTQRPPTPLDQRQEFTGASEVHTESGTADQSIHGYEYLDCAIGTNRRSVSRKTRV